MRASRRSPPPLLAFAVTDDESNPMTRRLHVAELSTGLLRLDERQSHHARDVLRLPLGGQVELFDNAGHAAQATIVSLEGSVELRIDEMRAAEHTGLRWTVASAVPKGNRADWMIEKLSELGTWRFIPLATQRAVVLPEGRGKRSRWQRIAEESAKQSRRSGVMRIEELTELATLLDHESAPAWFFSTSNGAARVADAAGTLALDAEHLLLLIGPEGGWTVQEEQAMRARGLTAVALGTTILRVETACIAAAAIIAAMIGRPSAAETTRA
jgi:16S rRNA (uracil1498-N3)-methyltransferase